MSERPETDCRETAPLRGIYSQSSPNETISLGRISAEIRDGNAARLAELEASLQFVPDQKLVFVAGEATGDPFEILRALSAPRSELKIGLLGRAPPFKVIQTAAGRFIPNRSVVTVTQTACPIKRAVFHLFNFPEFYASSDYTLHRTTPTGESFKRCGRLIAGFDGWRVTIAASEGTLEAVKSLEQRGGWRITHLGEIIREDGTTFSTEELEKMLLVLHHCLSFAMGRWVGIALPIGFDESNTRVFEQWGIPMASEGAWNGSSSCFDSHHGDMLAALIPGFWKLWSNTLWTKPLGEAIYWYLGASDRRVGVGVDTGLILAQAALELLAWNYCIRDRALVSKAAFQPGKLSAADRLRLLVSSLGIPMDLPTEFPKLDSRQPKPWADGLEAVTSIRNLLVHPHENKSLPENSYYEAWKLSLWYIDLVILRLCGYTGKYANRLTPTRWVGVVESVPWAGP